MLMALGPFRFSLDLAALESLQDRETARIEQMQRAGAMPTPQFLGPGERAVMIDAVIYKEVLAPGGPLQVELMRVAIRQGLRLPLIARSGHFYGFFMIEEMSIEKTHVLPNGTFQKMEVTLRLIRAPRGVSLFGVQLF